MRDIEPFVYRWFDDPKHYGGNDTGLSVNCPFCENRYGTGDTKHKLQISIVKEVVHCFRCDYSASWIKFVMQAAGMHYIEALGELYVRPNVKDFQIIDEAFDIKEVEEIVTKFKLPKDFQGIYEKIGSKLLSKARKYVKSRGFDKKYWKKYNLGVSSEQGWWLIIPIEDDYWQGRRLFDWMEPKYKNPPAASRHYIFNSAALDKYEEVVVCEGAFSAMSIGDNAIGLIRKHVTKEQIKRLIQSDVSRFILTIEPNAFPSMSKLADGLSNRGKEVVLWCYDDGDPNDTEKPSTVMDYGLKTKLSLLLSDI